MSNMLPKIASPTYELTIPSTGEKSTYRPYVNREEKMLMMAKESGKQKDVVNATKKLIEACVEKVTDAGKLTTFDLDYIFVKLRAVSVGETASPTGICGELSPEDEDENTEDACQGVVTLPVDFGSLEPTRHENHTNKILLSESDGIGVIMRYPTVDMSTKYADKKITQTEQFYDMFVSCIESIYDSEKTYSASEYTQSDLNEFVDSLQGPMVEKIKNQFFDTMPSLEAEVKATCPKCGKEHSVTLKGIEDFF